MASVKSPKAGNKAKPEAPSSLRMELFAPGMTPLHRAGLGGLACTLKCIERQYQEDVLTDRDVPGGPWQRGQPPWTIDHHSVTLNFAGPRKTKAYLKRLYGLAFDLKGGLIYLPGQYAHEPAVCVRAELQAGLVLTFLQHGRVRSLAKESTPVQYDPDGHGTARVVTEFKKCSGYKHQAGYEEIVHGDELTLGEIEVIGPLSPGSVVRHVAYSAATRCEDPPTRILPLYFALIGCLSLAVNRGVGVLLVPDVADLLSFAATRPFMTPGSPRECRIAGATDAALQAQVRLWSKRVIGIHDLPAIHAVTFRPTAWASQQKSRVSTILVPTGDEDRLRRFEIAMAELPPKVLSRTINETAGRGKKKVATERTESFWVDSVIRPLIADNLALGRPWYAGFTRLMTALDSNNKPIREKVRFEMKGLNAMVNNKAMWDSVSEEVVVRAVHEALRSRYGRIADENKGKAVAMKKRWAGEYDRWRLAFAGAKTADKFRNALCDLFSRAGGNSVLREKWTAVLPMLNEKQWQQARDLALLALPSYGGQVGGGSDNEANKD